MQKWVWPKVIITEEHKAKICLDYICEFMSLVKEELDCPEKPNLTTKDYTLKQFQCWIWRKLDNI